MNTVFTPEEVRHFERETWSRCASGYMDSFGVLTNEAIPALLDAANVADGSRVLDVGTGPGNVAAAVRQRGGTVIGVDFSATMLAEARRRNPEVEFKETNAHELPFPDNEFDAVVSNLAVHHMGAPQQFLGEARRVLRNGGKIAFTIWSAPEKLAAFGLFFAALQNHLGEADLPHGPLFGVSDFSVFHNMVQRAGFQQSQVSELDLVWRMSSLDAYWDGFSAWANLSGLPQNLKEAVKADVRQAAKAYQNGAGFAVPNPAILVTAVR